MVGRWFSQGTPVSSTSKTDCHCITEILLKVTLISVAQLLVYRNNNFKKMQWTCSFNLIPNKIGRCGDRMVVGFTITYTISANHHSSCEFKSRSWRGVLDTTLCD